MFNILSNLLGKNSHSPAVIESDIGVNPVEDTDIDEGFEALNNSQENRETESGYNTETEEPETQDLLLESEYEIVDQGECEEFFECAETQEELEALNSSFESKAQGRTVSYVLKPLFYTAKYGAKALSATTVVVSYTLSGTSHAIAGMSYIPHGASKVLEKCKGEDENTVGHKITTSSQNLLNFTSGAIYAVSYVPYGAGKALYKISDMTDWVDSSLSSEKIEQICTKSDLFVNNLSSKLKGIKTENFSQVSAIAS